MCAHSFGCRAWTGHSQKCSSRKMSHNLRNSSSLSHERKRRVIGIKRVFTDFDGTWGWPSEVWSFAECASSCALADMICRSLYRDRRSMGASAACRTRSTHVVLDSSSGDNDDRSCRRRSDPDHDISVDPSPFGSRSISSSHNLQSRIITLLICEERRPVTVSSSSTCLSIRTQ